MSEDLQTKNLLPKDGIVEYYNDLFSNSISDTYFEALLTTIEWRQDELYMFGKKIITKRKVAWYGEKPFEYTYSKSTKRALPWTKELEELKDVIQKNSGQTFNSCLLNLYHDGNEGMGWHADNEKELLKHGAIASLSFGAERKFVLKHRATNEKVEIYLEHGSLLMMKGTTQDHWLHRLPPTKKVLTPRINLTFRTIETP